MKYGRRWYSTRKAMTLVATIAFFIVIAGMAIGVPAAILCNRNSNSTSMEIINEESSEIEIVEEVIETEISVEEYYEEELAMDESTENVEYQEPKEQTQVPETDKFPYYIKVNRLMNTVTVYAKDESGNESDNIVINVVYYGSGATFDTEQVMPDTEQVIPDTEITESNTEQVVPDTEIIQSNTE